MKKNLARVCLFLLLAAGSCSKEKNEEVDTEYPVIDLSAGDAFPKQCSSIQRGQKFTFKARFSDNGELGSYSLDIHHNFDHHTHSTEVVACNVA